MGRQTRFHMLPDDCRRFLHFLQERDPVIVTEWHSPISSEVQAVIQPWASGGMYCLWNQAILPDLKRRLQATTSISASRHPLLNSAIPLRNPNCGTASFRSCKEGYGPALAATTRHSNLYDAVVRWIRKNFVRDLALGHNRDSIGPAAYEWFKGGGLLLPNFRPPLTDAWLGWASVQNQHRGELRTS